jgi:hypothetical protein
MLSSEHRISHPRKGVLVARRVRTLSAILIVAGLVGVAAGSAAQKFSFFGPYGGALCNGGGVVAGTEGDWGFANIHAPRRYTRRCT